MAGENLKQADLAVFQLEHRLATAKRARERIEQTTTQRDLVARGPAAAAQHRAATRL